MKFCSYKSKNIYASIKLIFIFLPSLFFQHISFFLSIKFSHISPDIYSRPNPHPSGIASSSYSSTLMIKKGATKTEFHSQVFSSFFGLSQYFCKIELSDIDLQGVDSWEHIVWPEKWSANPFEAILTFTHAQPNNIFWLKIPPDIDCIL